MGIVRVPSGITTSTRRGAGSSDAAACSRISRTSASASVLPASPRPMIFGFIRRRSYTPAALAFAGLMAERSPRTPEERTLMARPAARRGAPKRSEPQSIDARKGPPPRSASQDLPRPARGEREALARRAHLVRGQGQGVRHVRRPPPRRGAPLRLAAGGPRRSGSADRLGPEALLPPALRRNRAAGSASCSTRGPTGARSPGSSSRPIVSWRTRAWLRSCHRPMKPDRNVRMGPWSHTTKILAHPK